jgi:flagella basal body P-ring formation protein FlgA
MRLALSLLLLFGAVASLAGAPPAPGPSSYSLEALTAACSRDLVEHFNLEGDLQLEVTHPWVPERAVANDWTAAVVDFPTTPTSTMLLHCEVRDAAGSQLATLIVHAALWRDAWAAHLPIDANAVFDAARLETRRCDFLREHDLLPATMGDETYVFTHSLQVGRVLTWRDIGRHPLVKKGDVVQAVAAEGLLSISMKVLALQSGVKGDTISVRNPESNKDFTAQITDKDHVQVQF